MNILIPEIKNPAMIFIVWNTETLKNPQDLKDVLDGENIEEFAVAANYTDLLEKLGGLQEAGFIIGEMTKANECDPHKRTSKMVPAIRIKTK